MNLQDYEAVLTMLDHATPFAIAGLVCMVFLKLSEVKVAGKRTGWLPITVKADQLRKSNWRIPYAVCYISFLGLGTYVGIQMWSVLPNMLKYAW